MPTGESRGGSGAAAPLRILVLCTGNSARSQIAEALLVARAADRVDCASAGVDPASRVSRYAVDVLAAAGIDWSGRSPQGLETVADRPWDVVLTVCDHAREVCPVLPGARHVHWGLPDPAHVEPEAARREAFRETFGVLSRRVDALLALPLEDLRGDALGATLQSLAETG